MTLYSVVDKYHPFGAIYCLLLEGRRTRDSTQRLNFCSQCIDGVKSDVNKINAHVKTSNIKLFPQKIRLSMQN
jgi:hypothetical protein